jgi:hypothetical protein
LFSSLTIHWALKVRKPIIDQRKSLSLDAINAHPSLSLVTEQTSGLKDLKMPGGRLPCVLKYGRYLSGSHRTSIEIDREQHAPSSGVRQSAKYCLVGVWLPSAFRHR